MVRLAMSISVAFLCALPARAQSPPAATTRDVMPSIEFAREALNTLTSRPENAAAKWQEIARRRPVGILRAIAAAERQGWKPTATTLHHKRGVERRRTEVIPIAFGQDLYANDGSGEMLVWNWDDGNPNTAEGTVYVRSFVTGNSVTFNIQFAGDTYDEFWISNYEPTDSESGEWGGASPASFNFGSAGGLGFVPVRLQKQKGSIGGGGGGDVGALMEENPEDERRFQDKCRARAFNVGTNCIFERADNVLMDGVKNAAVDAGINGVRGAASGGLAGAISGAVAGAGWGFVSGVVGSMIWGADYNCEQQADQMYQDCLREIEVCRQSQFREGCYWLW